jgi:hypothetical protein
MLNKIRAIIMMIWQNLKSVFTAKKELAEKTSPELSSVPAPKPATVSADTALPENSPKLEVITPQNPPETPKTSEIEVSAGPEVQTHIIDKNVNLPKPDKKLEFIKSLRLANEQGYDVLIPYCHAALESGNFEHIIGDWQFFGLRKPTVLKPPAPGWNGKTARVITHEWVKKQIGDYDKFEYQITKWKTDAVIIAEKTYTKLADIKRTMFPALVNFYIKEVGAEFCDHKSADDGMIFYLFQIERLYPESWANKNNVVNYINGLFDFKFQYATANPEEYKKSFNNLFAHFRANGIYGQINEILEQLIAEQKGDR